MIVCGTSSVVVVVRVMVVVANMVVAVMIVLELYELLIWVTVVTDCGT